MTKAELVAENEILKSRIRKVYKALETVPEGVPYEDRYPHRVGTALGIIISIDESDHIELGIKY